MPRKKYYSLKEILKTDSDWHILLGKKSNGKSYATKSYAIEQFFKTGNYFAYIRRKHTERKDYNVDLYFNDAPIEKISKGRFDTVVCKRGKIYAAKSELGVGLNDLTLMGFAVDLEGYQDYSSLAYSNDEHAVTTYIFEEFITSGYYLPNEVNRLMILTSTMLRGYKGKIFLLGNTISRLCPYYADLGLKGIPRQAIGTIEVYNKETELMDEFGKPSGEFLRTKIAVENIGARGDQNNMFFGSSAKMINNGLWECKPEPHLPESRRNFECVYSLVFKFNEFLFLMEFLKKDNNYCWYVTRKTSDIQNDSRVVMNMPSMNPKHTKGFIPLNNNERKIFQYIKQDVVFFGDDLTGNEYHQAIQNINVF